MTLNKVQIIVGRTSIGYRFYFTVVDITLKHLFNVLLKYVCIAIYVFPYYFDCYHMFTAYNTISKLSNKDVE